MSKKIVFDLVGRFTVVARNEEGSEYPEISTRHICLESDVDLKNGIGKEIWESHALRLAREHIQTKGPVRCWLEEWYAAQRTVEVSDVVEPIQVKAA